MVMPKSPLLAAPAVVWFRDDLRLADNPALSAAAASGRPLLCLYVHDQGSDGQRPLGGAALWWLHGALAGLAHSLVKNGGSLVILAGPAAAAVETFAAEADAAAFYWNRRYDAPGRTVDARVKATLKARGIAVESFNGHLLREPWTLMNKAGAPFRQFTAYWRAAWQDSPPPPLPAPDKLVFHPLPASLKARSQPLDRLGLEPRKPDWAGGLRAEWCRGEEAARERLFSFIDDALTHYATARDRPDRHGTSKLSPYLRFGNISARQIWHAVQAAANSGRASQIRSPDKFLAELGWREFNYHLLFHYPELATRNFQPRFDAMPWRKDSKALRAWQHGRTGYPLVDAGMRELWTTGWMHNRVRMVAASFLVKHLLIDWREGEAWFWDTLVDADHANNAANWQWVAGTGADAAPYFRVFNPTLQAEKFDPDGAYVRRWIPELAGPGNYLSPIIGHAEARRRALASLDALAPT
jgi:deoxyribodipyrimidine photo-lyase